MLAISVAILLAMGYPVSVVPRPARLAAHPGTFVLTEGSRIFAIGDARPVAATLREQLSPATGLSLPLVERPAGSNLIALNLDPSLSELGSEGYRLNVSASRIAIKAKEQAGLFYGVQTLRQLLPPSALSASQAMGVDWAVPCLEIEDSPRFPWRGAQLDVSRHFFPISFLHRFVDLLALYKMNVLHLHLTDDQGWRMEIRRYPKLTEVGAWRREKDGKRYGGFYTQAELKDLVAFAKSRFVTIVPEIEMPGHAQAAIAAYPEFGNTKRPIKVAATWGIHPDILSVDDSTIRAMQDILEEVTEVFPSLYIHVGGDEAPKEQWVHSPATQARKKQLGLKDEESLQGWFADQMADFLAKKGRRLIGWEPMLRGLAPGSAVMSWRSEEPGVEAVRAGYSAVMAPYMWTYLDQAMSKDQTIEPEGSWGYLSLERLYSYRVVPDELTPADAERVLGAETALWTEPVPDVRTAECMLFPRICAMAEVLWSPTEGAGYRDFYHRMVGQMARLKVLRVNVHPIEPYEAPPVGGWKQGEFGPNYSAREWDVSGRVTGPGTYEARLEYFGGDERLDIQGAELLEDGVVVATDAHAGYSGGTDQANRYRFTVSGVKPNAKYRLRAIVRVGGQGDSTGEVRFERSAAGALPSSQPLEPPKYP